MIQKSVILADKRVASTYMQFALDSHPDVKSCDELFIYSGRAKKRQGISLYKTMAEKNKFGIIQYLDYVYNLNEGNPVCFRLMYNQEDKYKVLRFIMDQKIHIIHLYRNNQFKRVFSRWTAGEINPKPRNIDPGKIFKEIEESMKRVDKYRKILKKYNNVIEIEMMDLFGEKEGDEGKQTMKGAFNVMSEQKTYLKEETNKKIIDFLKLTDYKMYSTISQKNKNPIWDYIKNKKEVIQFFKERSKVKWLP